MVGRSGIWISCLLVFAMATAESAMADGAIPCAGVVLTPSSRQTSNSETLREIQEILLKRILAVHEERGLNHALGVSLHRDHFVLDAPGMTCLEAMDLADSWIVRATTVEIGLADSAPQFRAVDLESHVELVNQEVILRLRRHAAERFQSLTHDNIGGTIVIRINGGAAIKLPIRTEQVSGLIVLDGKKVPEDSFVAGTILPIVLEVGGCGSCLGEYREK
jgi:hypothetical protein